MNIRSVISVLLSLSLVFISVFFVTGCGEEEAVTSSDTVTSAETVTSEPVSSNDSAASSSSEAPSSKKSASSKVRASSKSKATSSETVKLSAKEKVFYGQDPEMYKIGLANEGNSARIASLMKKAQKGGSYTVAALGGSISMGAGASGSYSSYGAIVCEWFSGQFPNAEFSYVNAGLGSTNPEMACYRLQTDLLQYNPDFVIIDFTVNTYLDYDLYNTYSTLLNKILNQKNAPAVMGIHFTSCDKTYYAASKYVKNSAIPSGEITKALREYQIPTMSYHDYVWNRIDRKIISWREIGSDYIHPNDTGHLIAANLIISHLKTVQSKLSSISTKAPSVPGLSTDSYYNLGYITNQTKNVKMTGGFSARNNSGTSTRGWRYDKSDEASTLTVPLTSHKSLRLFMSFDSGAAGSIKVTGANGKTQTISSSQAQTPTLIELQAMGNSLTITSEMTSGGFTIYGIGVNK